MQEHNLSCYINVSTMDAKFHDNICNMHSLQWCSLNGVPKILSAYELRAVESTLFLKHEIYNVFGAVQDAVA
jgi:hypothetical protein